MASGKLNYSNDQSVNDEYKLPDPSNKYCHNQTVTGLGDELKDKLKSGVNWEWLANNIIQSITEWWFKSQTWENP